MMLAAVLAASPPPEVPNSTFLGMPAAVVAALVIGTASVTVALLTTFVQFAHARSDRAEAARVRSEERDEQLERDRRKARVKVHSAITNRFVDLSREYGDHLVAVDGWDGSTPKEPVAPSKAPLLSALTGILTSLNEEAVYRAAEQYLGRIIAHISDAQFLDFLTVLQLRLDDWFVGNATAIETSEDLDRMANTLREVAEAQSDDAMMTVPPEGDGK